MSKRLVTDDQAHILAEMYTWDAVASILQGSCAPRTTAGQKAADQVIAQCKRQQLRLIKVYDQPSRRQQGEKV